MSEIEQLKQELRELRMIVDSDEFDALDRLLRQARSERDSWRLAQEECHELQLLAEGQLETAKATIADLAANNVELVHQVQRLEQELRETKRVVEAARLLRNHITEFGELEPAMWGESYDNLDTALALVEIERASGEAKKQ